MTAQRLRSETDRLLDRVAVWTPGRWAVAVRPGDAAGGEGGDDAVADRPATRADLAHRLAQRLADRAADDEGCPRRAVPRLEHDPALPDQLRVLSDDLLTGGAGDAVLAGAADEVSAVRRLLS